jgi:hypothetical protein
LAELVLEVVAAVINAHAMRGLAQAGKLVEQQSDKLGELIERLRHPPAGTPSVPDRITALETADEQGNHAMAVAFALAFGDRDEGSALRTLEALLAAGFPVDARSGETGVTPLMQAA